VILVFEDQVISSLPNIPKEQHHYIKSQDSWESGGSAKVPGAFEGGVGQDKLQAAPDSKGLGAVQEEVCVCL